MADDYLPHTVSNVPASWVFDDRGAVRPNFRHYMSQGVVRVIAGPEECHVVIDIKRPYHRNQQPQKPTMIEAGNG